jgi:hypothetical protein
VGARGACCNLLGCLWGWSVDVSSTLYLFVVPQTPFFGHPSVREHPPCSGLSRPARAEHLLFSGALRLLGCALPPPLFTYPPLTPRRAHFLAGLVSIASGDFDRDGVPDLAFVLANGFVGVALGGPDQVPQEPLLQLPITAPTSSLHAPGATVSLLDVRGRGQRDQRPGGQGCCSVCTHVFVVESLALAPWTRVRTTDLPLPPHTHSHPWAPHHTHCTCIHTFMHALGRRRRLSPPAPHSFPTNPYPVPTLPPPRPDPCSGQGNGDGLTDVLVVGAVAVATELFYATPGVPLGFLPQRSVSSALQGLPGGLSTILCAECVVVRALCCLYSLGHVHPLDAAQAMLRV